jgi:hypothetical protein
MTSLDEAYSRSAQPQRLRRIVGGGALVVVGVVGVLAAMALVWVGGDTTAAKTQAGVAAGVAVPVMLLGVVVVLPASTRQRVGVVAGALLSWGGVWLFWNAYPDQWTRTAESMAFETLSLYGAGCALALWFVFAAIASLRLRNNPQGTVSLEVVRQGKTQTIEVSQREYSQLVSDGGDPEQIVERLNDDD